MGLPTTFRVEWVRGCSDGRNPGMMSKPRQIISSSPTPDCTAKCCFCYNSFPAPMSPFETQ
ncbi:hypothetical protein M413DRAFT_447808 [Hebeloma cylindrosporum]|uniref:Uncharacterized protein n=1 Tax=Hebeloma cylindrosporum TaxID=76867 RepID=A0A0C3C3Y6_HEBCY|nr:hypothetical protein M413DRAFT_447808 [Hebeloma cylindrosporum h7]